jgi:hypothetical protein
MRTLLYFIAIVMILGWVIGVFAYSAGGLIYALLVLAAIAFLLGFLGRGHTTA